MWKGVLPTESIFDKPIEDVIKFYQKDIDLCKKYNLIPLQAHAPFPSHLEKYPYIFDYAIETFKKCIQYSDIIGVKNLVIHGISRSADSKLSYEEVYDLNMKLYTSLIDTLEGTNVTVCLENLFSRTSNGYIEGVCSDPYEAVDYIDKLNALCKDKPHFGLCLDTGHLNLVRQDFREFVGILGNRIKCTHIHDNSGYNDDHRAPYAGTIPWECFLEAFKSIDYKGYISFETFYQYIPYSNLLPEDLVIPMLNTIGSIAKYFAEEISGKK
jgi:sugar phosphate isomerase/epimerase